jgi:sugar phosphate isomerase/epimerase
MSSSFEAEISEGPKARALTRSDWILSHFSLRGTGFDERLDAAADAGFAAVGMLIPEYQKLRRQGRSDADLLEALASRGLVLAEIEALLGWAASGDALAMSREHLDVACHMAEVFGARHLQAIGPFEGTVDDAARAFARVCDRAAEVGLLVAIEFLPFNNIDHAGVALDIANRAGRRNGGLCVDVWHHFRGARDEALLRAIPSERIVSIQLNDGTLEPQDSDYIRDCMENRKPMGEGEFDLPTFLGILDETGTDVPWSLEVISTELQKLDAAAAARRIANGVRAFA